MKVRDVHFWMVGKLPICDYSLILVQVFPVPLLTALGARSSFTIAAKQEGFEFQEIHPSEFIREE
jgi:hypothetical protein